MLRPLGGSSAGGGEDICASGGDSMVALLNRVHSVKIKL